MKLSRRSLIQKASLLCGALFLNKQIVMAQEVSFDPVDEKETIYTTMLGWKIGPHCYSFRLFPFEEAVKKCIAVGAKSFEISTSQRLVAGRDVKVGPDMSKEDFKLYQKLCADNACVPHVMGICNATRKHFDFAAALGVSVMNSEVGFDRLHEVNKLADEYKINVALHNHPKPSIYWNPDIVLEKLKDCGSRIGACCDTGHFVRSGLDPVESVRKFGNRIFSFHIKDIDEKHRDVPLGKGICKIAEILNAAAKNRVRAVFSLEYESSWENNMPQIAEGIRFFHETTRQICLVNELIPTFDPAQKR